MANETLLSSALHLSCHARILTNELKALLFVSLSVLTSIQSSEYYVQRHRYISVLSGVSHVINSVRTMAAMIDRFCCSSSD